MNIKNPIMNELETLAPTLINVPKTIPYSLQDGYFENLSSEVLKKIKSEIDLDYSFSTDYLKSTIPYSVPENYFLNFADELLFKINSNQIGVLEPLIPLLPYNPYKVATGYFENLSNQIFEKIRLLEERESVLLVNFNKITPYTVSSGYFEAFPNDVLNKLKSEHSEEAFGIDFNITKANPYQIPADYFNNLSSNIFAKITDENEPEFGFTKANPYKVPVGYFESLADDILLKVNPSINQDVPQGYFDALPNIILQKIRGLEVESELMEIAPLLNTINKAPINYVPTGYFEQLEQMATQTQAVSAKVIGIRRKTSWFKNAIAACLIGTLGFTAYQIMEIGSNKDSVKSIQSLSKDEVPVNIPTADINVDVELSKVDDASLAKYMNNIEMPTEQATAHFQDVNSGDIDAALQDIPDDAIQQHLDETGELNNAKN